jgi:hypothetical protein
MEMCFKGEMKAGENTAAGAVGQQLVVEAEEEEGEEEEEDGEDNLPSLLEVNVHRLSSVSASEESKR